MGSSTGAKEWSEETWREDRGGAFQGLCYSEYQVSGGKAPKGSNPAISHPYLTSGSHTQYSPKASKRASGER